MKTPCPPLILASTSVYRRELLLKLGLPFTWQAPAFDEDAAKTSGLSPIALAESLALGKALSLDSGTAVIIGGDQLVALGNKILGKPKTFEKAVAQLQSMSGREHLLVTAMCVAHAGKARVWSNLTRLHMRKLSDLQIRNYVTADEPFDCAGSYKIEKNALSLFEKIETTDFSGIQGIPLLELSQVLIEFGYSVPGEKYEKEIC
jgi:septum formation protein